MDIEQKQKQIIRQTNMLFLLADMIDTTAANLQQMHVNLNTYRFDIKQKIKGIRKNAFDLVEFVSKTYENNTEMQISYGDTSDKLLEEIIRKIYPEKTQTTE